MPSTKGYKLIGGCDSFQTEEGGTVYFPGDTVPISDAVAAHMTRQLGIIFEGIDIPSTGAGQSAEIGPELKK